jgi:hypothetical protein
MIMYETDDAVRNRASAHNHRGGTVRTFKRLFPVFLTLVLLAGVATARPAGETSRSPVVGISQPQFCLGHNHTPPPPRLYFGTVVRDTADEDYVGPDQGEMSSILQQQAPQDMPLWNAFFTWFSLLLVSR